MAVCVLTTFADHALGQAKLGDPDYRFKIGDKIEAAFKLDIHLRPGPLHHVAEIDEAVENHHQPADE